MKTIAEKYHWKSTPSDITVETTRKLAAKHGKEALITISWTNNGDGTLSYQTTTAGKTRYFADQAAVVRDHLMKILGAPHLILKEDRRCEHTD